PEEAAQLTMPLPWGNGRRPIQLMVPPRSGLMALSGSFLGQQRCSRPMKAVSALVERPGISPSVLVVADDQTRDRYGEWLETAGYLVSNCPGPSASEHACLGMRGLPCPLSQAADIVLLD